jgi:hypothetical protein
MLDRLTCAMNAAFDGVRVFPTAAAAIQCLSEAAPPPLPLPSLGCFAEPC